MQNCLSKKRLQNLWLLLAASGVLGSLLLAGCPESSGPSVEWTIHDVSYDPTADHSSDETANEDNSSDEATNDSSATAPGVTAAIEEDDEDLPSSFSYTDDDLIGNGPADGGGSSSSAGLSISWFAKQDWSDSEGIVFDPNVDKILDPIFPDDPETPDPPDNSPPDEIPSNPGAVDVIEAVHLLRQTFAALVALHPITKPVLDLEELGYSANTPNQTQRCPKLVMIYGSDLGGGLFYYGDNGAGCSSSEIGDHTFYGGIPFYFDINERSMRFEYPTPPNPMVVQYWTFDDVATWGEYTASVSNVYESPSSVIPEGRSLVGALDLAHVNLGAVASQNFNCRVFKSGRLEIPGAIVTLSQYGDTVTLWLHNIVVDPSLTGSFLPIDGEIAYKQDGLEHKLGFNPSTPSTRQVTHTVAGTSETITLPEY